MNKAGFMAMMAKKKKKGAKGKGKAKGKFKPFTKSAGTQADALDMAE